MSALQGTVLRSESCDTGVNCLRVVCCGEIMEGKRHRIIGTAGHIDHGKTRLVKALTGTDTDRLSQEKERGITIENGFAPFLLPDGEVAGIIDVPGHERFIKNMLAGAGGIDIVMLVIAADEGVMPQTVEHLDILTLLGIKKGLVVITKSDLSRKPHLQEEIARLVKDTFLETAPVLQVSAATGEGVERLREVLWELCKEAGREVRSVPFRLPVDRVFSLKGFGTVVTGTLLDGELSLEAEGMLYPAGRSVKIRQLQVYGENVIKAFPGQRVAVNLSGIGKEEISRGEVLALAGSLASTKIADARLQLLKSQKRSLKNGSRVHLYHGASNLVCRVFLAERGILKPGEEASVQLRMEQETVMRAGDRFVVRFYSPLETIGGGVIENPNAQKGRQRRGSQERKEQSPEPSGPELQKEKEEMFHRLSDLYLEAGFAPLPTAEVKKRFSKNPVFSEVFFSMVKKKILVKFDETHYLHRKYRQAALAMVYTIYEEDGEIQTGVFRDRMGISRKCAIALLEGFDKERITRLAEGKRRVVKQELR